MHSSMGYVWNLALLFFFSWCATVHQSLKYQRVQENKHYTSYKGLVLSAWHRRCAAGQWASIWYGDLVSLPPFSLTATVAGAGMDTQRWECLCTTVEISTVNPKKRKQCRMQDFNFCMYMQRMKSRDVNSYPYPCVHSDSRTVTVPFHGWTPNAAAHTGMLPGLNTGHMNTCCDMNLEGILLSK